MIEQFLRRDSVLGSVTNLGVSAGTLSSNLSAVTFANSNGVSFGLNTNGVITASGAGGGGGSLNISAGTTSSNVSAVTFSNANGVSFGFDGSNVTATVATNYQSQGAYLTTAALSQDSSKYAGTGFTTATTAGTNIVGTLNTGGLSMGVPAYLTTAMQSNAATISNINVSAGTTSNNLSAITFSNSNNVSFGLNGSTLTGSIATTYAGTGITTTTTAGTAVVGTLNTSGLSLGVPAFLTTAMQSNAATISNINVSAGTTSTNASAFTFSNLNNVTFGLGTGASAGVITASIPSQSAAQINVSAGTTSTNASAFTFSNLNNVSFGLGTGANAGVVTGSIATTYAGTGVTTATTAGTAIVGTLNTSGLSMGVPAFLTTAMQSNAATISNINISAGTTSTNASAFTFANANGVSFGLGTGASAGSITGSIATTYAGTGFTTATTAGTAIVGTLNTSGLSMGVPAFLTTAMQSNAATISNINISAGTTSTNASAFTFANANNVSFGLGTGASAGSVTASIATTYAGTGVTTTTTAGTAIVGTLNTSGLSLGVPAFLTTAALSQNTSNYAGINSAITGGSLTVNTSGISINIPIATLSFFQNIDLLGGLSTSAPVAGQNLRIEPFILPQPCSIGFVRWLCSFSLASASQTGTTANTSFTMNRSFTNAIDFHTQGVGASSLSLQHLVSTQGTWVFQTSVTAGANGSQYTVTYNITYPTRGTTSQYTTSYATSTGQYEFNTTILTAFTGPKFIDIGFSTLMTAGNYWLVFGSSSAFASNTGPANLSSASLGFNSVVATNYPTVHGFPGQGTNSSNCNIPGFGSLTSGAALLSTASIPLASIQQDVGFNGLVYFQFLRYA